MAKYASIRAVALISCEQVQRMSFHADVWMYGRVASSSEQFLLPCLALLFYHRPEASPLSRCNSFEIKDYREGDLPDTNGWILDFQLGLQRIVDCHYF